MIRWSAFMKIFLYRLLRPILFLRAHMLRGMTLGVRALVFDAQGKVLLVKHSYVPGWYLPGGGVEHDQSVAQAVIVELEEEANVKVEGPMRFVSLYFNPKDHVRDHVALFHVPHWSQEAPPKPNGEIIATGFFAPDDLPDDTTAATRRRLDEYFERSPISERW